MLHQVRYWLRAVFRHADVEREMHDEMQHHLERRTAAFIASGMSADEARLAAKREFGNPAGHQDAGRDARRTQWIDSVRSDVRFALRYFARKPLASATIVLILALGIGGHAFQMSILLSLIKRPPAGLSADVPLVRVRGMYRTQDATRWYGRRLGYSELREMEALPNTFAAVAAWTSSRVIASVGSAADAAPLYAQFVTDDYFKTLGIGATHGPGLPADAETGEPRLAGVIADATWEDAFNRGNVADKVMTLNGVAVRVAGVAPPAFTGALPVDNRRMMWLPLSARAAIIARSDSIAYANLDSAVFDVVGLLRPGVSAERASASARVVAARVAARTVTPVAAAARDAVVYDADVVPLRGVTDVGAQLPLVLSAWIAVAMMVLVIICTNVGGLMVSAGVSRRHEIAIRLSLGASRGRLIRQLLTESVLLALAGAALGLLVLRVIVAAASRIPLVEYVRPDAESGVLTILVAAGTGILFGVAPALHATKHGVGAVLKSTEMGATRRSRLHQAFVVAQVVVTQPLLVFIASMISQTLMRTPPGLPKDIPDHVLQLSVDVDMLPGSAEAKSLVVQRLVRRIGETPGIVKITPDVDPRPEVTLAVREEDRGPLARAGETMQVHTVRSAPGYFDLLDVPLLRGSDEAPTDTSLTMIIGSDLARSLWGTQDPIGKRFTQIAPRPARERDIVVTGVYDSRLLPNDGRRPRVYRSVKDWTAWRYLIRTAGPAAALADTIRRVAHEELPLLPIERPMTLTQVDEQRASTESNARLAMLSVAGLVLLLSSIGLYGIVALAVGQRRREIGVRMAIGARAAQVVSLFYRNGLMLGGLGLLLGLPVSLFGARYLPDLMLAIGLENARAPSLTVIGTAVGVVVLVVASIATLIPASRAATVNPVTVLREE